MRRGSRLCTATSRTLQWVRDTRASLFLIDEIVLEDRHLELERAIIVLVVDEEHADELLADIDLGAVILLRPCPLSQL